MDANELTLVYRARGMSYADAETKAAQVLAAVALHTGPISTITSQTPVQAPAEHEEIGTGLSAAISSFFFFASGAVIPILPFLFGLEGGAAVLVAAILVGVALMVTGSIVGLLSGASPLKRALRQLAIGFGAAGVTYLLGLAFGTTVG